MRIPKLHFTKRRLNKQRFILSLSIITYVAFALFAVTTIHSDIKANQKVKNQIAEYHKLKNNLNYKLNNSIANYNKYAQEEEKLYNQLIEVVNNVSDYIVTGYDSSKHCTGKIPTSRGYCITRDGTNLKGKTYKEARVVAADPRILPLGTVIFIKFYDKAHLRYSGIYKVCDTGTGVNGKSLDLYIKESPTIKPSKEAKVFGVVKARVTILYKGF